LSENVVKYRRRFSLNIGFFLFFVIIIYVAFNIFSYYTKKTVSEYEIVQGSIASNNIYKGIVIRNEEVVYSTNSGYLNYYQSSGDKVSVHDLIYSVDSKGMLNQSASDGSTAVATLGAEDVNELNDSIDTYMNTYSSIHFAEFVQYKNDLSSDINQAKNNQLLNMLTDEILEAESGQAFFRGYSSIPGDVMFYVDGYESLTSDTVTSADLNNSNYTREVLNTRTEIKSGEPAYKLIKNNNWSVVISISDEMAKSMEEDSNVRIRFCRDGFTTTASYTIRKSDGQNLLVMNLTRGMIRYANDRYISVELVFKEQTGLKIPNSSITEKEFYTIPVGYLTRGDDSNTTGFLVKKADEEDSKFTFISPTIYYKTDDYCYVDSEELQAGDLIKSTEGFVDYVVGQDVSSLKGVFNINKGYAVFKQINILYQSDEYTIVESGTDYGVALYDHIALDASILSENELIVDNK